MKNEMTPRSYVRRFAGMVLTLALFFGISTQAHGGDDANNAATWYIKAFAEFDRLTLEDWEVLYRYQGNPTVAPTRELRAILEKVGRGMDYIERGSYKEYADYNLDYSEGFELLLPHIGRLRAACKIMSADAMVRLHDGDSMGAANRVATMYRAAEHGRDDRILISSLVGQSIYNFTEKTATAGIDGGAFGPQESARLLEALSRYDRDDPFGHLDALVIEHELARTTMIQRFNNEDGKGGLEQLANFIPADQEGPGDQLRDITAAQFEQELQHYDNLMGRYLEIFNMEDREAGLAELKKIEEGLESGEYGVLTSLLLPAFSRVYERATETLESMDVHRKLLEQLAKGEADLREIANAAMWYQRGYVGLRKLSEEARAQVLSINAEEALEPEPDLEAALKTAEAALDQFREGAMIRRCDFKPFKGRLIEMVPDYVAGMQEALRFTRGNAKQLLDNGRADGACERLLIGFRMITHLGDGDTIMASVVAHAEFNEIMALIKEAIGKEQFSAANLALLHRAAVLANAGDPFGYRQAIATAQKELVLHLKYHFNFEDDPEERRGEIVSFIERSDGDRLLLLHLADGERHNIAVIPDQPHSTPGKNPTDAERSLDNLIDNEMLLAVRAQIHLVMDLLQEGQFVKLQEMVKPNLARIEERKKKARGDCRGAVAAFPKEEPKSPLTER